MLNVTVLAAMAAGACIAVQAEAQVYKCNEGGRVVYADRPCAGAAKPMDIRVTPESPDAVLATRLQSEANLGRLAVGQTARQVEQAWGTPKKKNIDTGTSGTREQWVYERKEGTTYYVYIRDGRLDSVSQHQEVPGNVTPPPPLAVTQPTRQEIEAVERASKADERRFVTEGATMNAVRTRIGAPDTRDFVSTGSGVAECWGYAPTARDAQTWTTVCFVGGAAYAVNRKIER